ncbi:MAG: chorismate-binding protein [Leptospiraceae bacterium]|nr:chorismate-binding protein [Leptospiraceae bacterium]
MPAGLVLKLLPANRAILFSDILDTIQTSQLDQVSDCLDQLDHLHQAGHHLAGYISYEAMDYQDSLICDCNESTDQPQLWMGVFKRYQVFADRMEAIKQLGKLLQDQVLSEQSMQDPESGYYLESVIPGTGYKRGDSLRIQARSSLKYRVQAAKTWLAKQRAQRNQFSEAFSQIQSELRSGNCYQINFTLPNEFQFEGDPLHLFTDLLVLQPVDDGAFVWHPHRALVSLSPENFVSAFSVSDSDDLTVYSKPMKGTAPRSADPLKDQKQRAELHSSPKTRAENAMILDLMRNDLGRHAAFGSVQVVSAFQTEAYPTVWQMTSTVAARLTPAVHRRFYSLFLRDMIPGASITGAPRLSARKIIQQLESRPRGIYTGCIGYTLGQSRNQASAGQTKSLASGHGLSNEQIQSRTGQGASAADRAALNETRKLPAMDSTALPAAAFNIAIRSFDLDLKSGHALFGSGCGIVYDSCLESEWQEYLHKQDFYRPVLDSFHLIETMRMQNGKIRLLDLHCKRLQHSIRSLGLDRINPELEMRILNQGLQAQLRLLALEHPSGDFRLRLIVNRHGFTLNAQAIDNAKEPGGVQLLVAAKAVYSQSPWQAHKSSQRQLYDVSWSDAQSAGYHDVLFYNESGHLVECATANILLYLPERGWCTPSQDCGALPGVYLALLRRRHHIQAAKLDASDLQRARWIGVCNALRGLRPVERIYYWSDGRPSILWKQHG